MPLSKVLNKTRGSAQSGTHAHYKGEFESTRKPGQPQLEKSSPTGGTPRVVDGSKRQTKENARDPEYRAARAKHFHDEALKAHAAHAAAKTPEEKLKYEAIIAHAADRTGVHARFVTKNQPGSKLADETTLHAKVVKHLHEDLQTKKADAKEQEKSDKAREQKRQDEDRARGQKKQDEKEKFEREQKVKEEQARKQESKPSEGLADEMLGNYAKTYTAKINGAEQSALGDYTGDAHKNINKALRSGERPDLEDRRRISALDSAIDKSSIPEHVTVYRGISSGAAAAQFSKLKPGDEYEDKGFTSVTANKNYLKETDMFKTEAMVHITLPKGSRAAPTQDLSWRPEEKELLLPRNQRFRLDRVEQSGSKTVYHVTAVQHEYEASVAKAEQNLRHYEGYKSDYEKKLDSHEIKSAHEYSTSYYTPINNALRRGESTEKHADLVKTLDSMIAKSSIPHDITLMRGAKGAEILKHYASMKPGDVFEEKAYTSTTASNKVKRDFEGDVELHFAVKAGSKGAPIPSKKEDEKEVLLPRGSKFKIEKMHHDTLSGKLIVHASMQ